MSTNCLDSVIDELAVSVLAHYAAAGFTDDLFLHSDDGRCYVDSKPDRAVSSEPIPRLPYFALRRWISDRMRIYNLVNDEAPHVYIRREPCAICGEVNTVGYAIQTDIWERVVPELYSGRDVCLRCFTKLADEALVPWDLHIVLVPLSRYSLHMSLATCALTGSFEHWREVPISAKRRQPSKGVNDGR